MRHAQHNENIEPAHKRLNSRNRPSPTRQKPKNSVVPKIENQRALAEVGKKEQKVFKQEVNDQAFEKNLQLGKERAKHESEVDETKKRIAHLKKLKNQLKWAETRKIKAL